MNLREIRRVRPFAFWSLVLLALGGTFSGCGDMQFGKPKKVVRKVSADPTNSKVAEQSKTKPVKKTDGKTAKIVAAEPIKLAPSMEDKFMGRVGDLIRQNVEDGPTLVVWLIDRSESAVPLADKVASGVPKILQQDAIKESLAAEPDRLKMAIALFGQEVEYPLEEPSSDTAEIAKVLTKRAPDASGKEMTFAAVAKVAEKYASYRSGGRQLLLAVVTDEVGDDIDQLESAIAAAKKAHVQVYVMGPPAPFGVANPLAIRGFMPSAQDAGKGDYSPSHGPETPQSQLAPLAFWNSGYGAGDALMIIDSGFGPWGLERLCRSTDGAYLALRPGDSDGGGGFIGSRWPTSAAMRYEQSVMSKYAPEYNVTYEKYMQSIEGNKAKKALIATAKLDRSDALTAPQMRFDQQNEAAMKNTLDRAQQAAAKLEPVVDKIYQSLQSGESDRTKLDSPRWKASYDLALGRACAANARIQGYNAMLAALKRGKSFTKEGAKTWVLNPSDKVETGSAIKNMADKGKKLLEGLVKDHPGTPWAALAEEELKTPLGWQWDEE
jgi:hypothetical protein